MPLSTWFFTLAPSDHLRSLATGDCVGTIFTYHSHRFDRLMAVERKNLPLAEPRSMNVAPNHWPLINMRGNLLLPLACLARHRRGHSLRALSRPTIAQTGSRRLASNCRIH